MIINNKIEVNEYIGVRAKLDIALSVVTLAILSCSRLVFLLKRVFFRVEFLRGFVEELYMGLDGTIYGILIIVSFMTLSFALRSKWFISTTSVFTFGNLLLLFADYMAVKVGSTGNIVVEIAFFMGLLLECASLIMYAALMSMGKLRGAEHVFMLLSFAMLLIFEVVKMASPDFSTTYFYRTMILYSNIMMILMAMNIAAINIMRKSYMVTNDAAIFANDPLSDEVKAMRDKLYDDDAVRKYQKENMTIYKDDVHGKYTIIKNDGKAYLVPVAYDETHKVYKPSYIVNSIEIAANPAFSYSTFTKETPFQFHISDNKLKKSKRLLNIFLPIVSVVFAICYGLIFAKILY